MLAVDNWCIKVNDRIYGPYTSNQLRKFAHEGRFAQTSLVAPAGGKEWRQAADETSFANFFGASPTDAGQQRSFGRARPKANVVETHPHRRSTDRPAGQASSKDARKESVSNFIVIFQVDSVAGNRIEPVLAAMGPTFRLAQNVWTVKCAYTAIGLRNSIAPFLRPQEAVFVIDATNGRTCWQNYAPEPHAKISAAFVGAKP
ncbi:MAG: DUF4339 domain-containing protein [Parvularculaceae bacterium]